ncbi:MAG: hypothetical protein CM15mP129_08610 [Chloroflexota bacterium]|nr:MAG: hypothetical protein CM15mP129_08610 [Chloroflexota bacterium]
MKGRNANPIPAKSAKNFLNALVANQEVSIKRITKDRYGRTVAELFKNKENFPKNLYLKKGFGGNIQKYSHKMCLGVKIVDQNKKRFFNLEKNLFLFSPISFE